jgi:hypothetical protein
MAIQLSATDIQLTSTSSNFPNAVGPLTFMSWINYANWSAGVNTNMVGLYRPGTTTIQIGSKASSSTIYMDVGWHRVNTIWIGHSNIICINICS